VTVSDAPSDGDCGVPLRWSMDEGIIATMKTNQINRLEGAVIKFFPFCLSPDVVATTATLTELVLIK